MVVVVDGLIYIGEGVGDVQEWLYDDTVLMTGYLFTATGGGDSLCGNSKTGGSAFNKRLTHINNLMRKYLRSTK